MKHLKKFESYGEKSRYTTWQDIEEMIDKVVEEDGTFSPAKVKNITVSWDSISPKTYKAIVDILENNLPKLGSRPIPKSGNWGGLAFYDPNLMRIWTPNLEGVSIKLSPSDLSILSSFYYKLPKPS